MITTRTRTRKKPVGIDPCLQAVRAQLMRRRRLDDRYLYPTTLDAGGNAHDRQRRAIDLLFEAAAKLAKRPPQPLPTRREIERARERLQQTAEHLRLIAVACGDHTTDFDRITTAVEVIERRADELERTVAIERDRGRGIEQAFAIQIGVEVRHLFGRPLHAVVAQLVSALTGRIVRAHLVRDWLKILEE